MPMPMPIKITATRTTSKILLVDMPDFVLVMTSAATGAGPVCWAKRRCCC